MSSRYNIATTETGYHFITDSGLNYTAYFTTYYLTACDNKEIEMPMLGFFCEPPRLLKDGKGYDEKVKNTIVGIIADYFTKRQNDGLLYVCDTSNGLGQHRNITFSKWFNEVNMPIERHKGTFSCESNGFYTSLLIHTENPDKDYYIEAFYRNLQIGMNYATQSLP